MRARSARNYRIAGRSIISLRARTSMSSSPLLGRCRLQPIAARRGAELNSEIEHPTARDSTTGHGPDFDVAEIDPNVVELIGRFFMKVALRLPLLAAVAVMSER